MKMRYEEREAYCSSLYISPVVSQHVSRISHNNNNFTAYYKPLQDVMMNHINIYNVQMIFYLFHFYYNYSCMQGTRKIKVVLNRHLITLDSSTSTLYIYPWLNDQVRRPELIIRAMKGDTYPGESRNREKQG